MNLTHRFTLSIVAFVVLILSSCGDASQIGTGVLDGERLNIAFTDTFDLSARIVDGGPTPTYRVSPYLDVRNRIIGELVDPLTGIARSEVYARVTLPSVEPDFKDAVLDSAIFVVELDTLGFYGDANATHTIDVHMLASAFPEEDTLFADHIQAKGELIGSQTLVPNGKDSVRIILHGNGTPQILAPQLRIPIDPVLGQKLLDDSTLFQSDSLLNDFFPGVVISSTPTGSSTIGLKMNNQTNVAGSNGLRLYFTKNDTVKSNYLIRFSRQVASYIDLETNASPLAGYIDNQTIGDSILICQGLSGVNSSITIGSLADIKDEVINYAELAGFLYPSNEVGGEEYFPFNIVAAKNGDDGLVSISDFLIAVQAGNVPDLFGGTLQDSVVDGQDMKYFSINLTNHIKELARDAEADRELVLTLTSKLQKPGRTVIYGPGHSEFPLKLKVTFTDIN